MQDLLLRKNIISVSYITSSPCLLRELKNLFSLTFALKHLHSQAHIAKTRCKESTTIQPARSVSLSQLQWPCFLIYLSGIYKLTSFQQTVVIVLYDQRFLILNPYFQLVHIWEMRIMDEVETEKLLCKTENSRLPRKL